MASTLRAEGIELKTAQSNIGMHPTSRHEASHVRCAGARVMPGVRCCAAGENLNLLTLSVAARAIE